MRTAAETKDVARATRRRRRILQTEFIFMKEYENYNFIFSTYRIRVLGKSSTDGSGR